MRDYSKDPFSLFFSGVESDRYFDIVTTESTTVLMSYLYFKKKSKKFIKERAEKCPDLKILIDSGAHTFLAKTEYHDKPVEYWESYLEEYIEWVKENKEHVFAVVELDIDDLVGSEKVEEWREKYFAPLEAEGIQVIYVWHCVRGEKNWEEMCKQYKYVGFSMMGDKNLTIDICSKMVNVASRYGAKCHGFAVTSFDFMTKIPFYTVDSTTWLVGTQFGEINFFDGRKMKRLKKAVWKGQYRNKLVAIGANWNLAEREEPYELIRINVLTFLEVEKYVRSLMKNKMYWIKKDHVKVEKIVMPKREPTDKLPRIPSDEWFSGDGEGWEEYCLALGIDVNIGKDDAIQMLTHYVNFILFDKEQLGKYTDEVVFELIDLVGMKSEVNTRKKAMEILPQIFTDNALAKRHDFENLSSKIGEERARPKEREEYIEEPQTVIMDIDKRTVESVLAQFIPEGTEMPEVEQYDEILREQGILAIRDEKGRLLKGQQVVRKSKKIYADSMYKLACDTCIKSASCPEYQAGYVCAFNKTFARFNTRDMVDIQDAMHSIVEANLERLQRAMMFEMMDGGVIDPTVTQLMDINLKYMQMMQQMENLGKQQMVAQQRIVVDSSGNSETVTTVSTNATNPQQGGFLSQLFGGMGDKKKGEKETIDVTPVQQDEDNTTKE